jgi:cell division protease FtsH
MDGFEANEGIILIAATNRPDVLDPALLRPGRFDRQITVPNPDVVGRERILRVHIKKVPIAPDVDLRTIARGTPGFSGADLANLVNESALLAARRNKRLVTQLEFEDAKDKVMMGAERRSMAMSPEEKRLTAYHEAGHAVVGTAVPSGIPVHKATIIPRGRALGMVKFLPEGDRYSMKYVEFMSQLTVAMDNITSGAAGDIQQATAMAKAMVTRYGFSDELGTVMYGENQEEVFLGMSMQKHQSISEQTAQKIDSEVRRLVAFGYEEARRILTDRRSALENVAQALLEHETLTGDEVRRVMDGGTIVRDLSDTPKGPTGSAVPAAGKSKKRGEGEEPTGGMEPMPT